MNLATWSRSSLALAGTAAGGEEELEEEEEEGRAPSLSARADAVVEFVVEFTFEDGRSTPSRTLPLLLPSAFFFKNRIFLNPSKRLVGVGGAIGEEGGAGEGASSQACLVPSPTPPTTTNPAAPVDTALGASASIFPILEPFRGLNGCLCGRVYAPGAKLFVSKGYKRF